MRSISVSLTSPHWTRSTFVGIGIGFVGGQRIGGYAQDREPGGRAEAAEDDQTVMAASVLVFRHAAYPGFAKQARFIENRVGSRHNMRVEPMQVADQVDE